MNIGTVRRRNGCALKHPLAISSQNSINHYATNCQAAQLSTSKHKFRGL